MNCNISHLFSEVLIRVQSVFSFVLLVLNCVFIVFTRIRLVCYFSIDLVIIIMIKSQVSCNFFNLFK